MATRTARPASQAGRFYTADPDALRQEVESYIDSASSESSSESPLGFISPHAGYTYSGKIAGFTYSQVKKLAPERVFVFAPSHHSAFSDASLWTGNAYETPLGNYPIDQEMVSRIQDNLPGAHCETFAESQEHSLEVQIPFLQVAAPDAQLVPVLIGDQALPNVQKIAQAVRAALGEDAEARGKVAFIASTDGYHGGSLDKCRESDKKLAEAIRSMDVGRLYAATQSREAMACGYGPIAAVMLLSKEYGAQEAIKLSHATSADAMPHGAGDYVVGYLSMMFC
ncbi:MAG: AmmeMemoRadiSam system protein B [Candidatus Sumerlaeia bacterium]